MIYLYILTGAGLIVSLIIDRKKTRKAINIAKKKFLKILPSFLLMIVAISIALFFMPDTAIAKLLGGHNLYLSMISASLVGSISAMPGFVVFPLGGLLIQKGISYTVLAAFTTSLMLVGVLTYPLEQKFLGTKITIIRNLIGFFIGLVVALAVGISYGEIL
ncbi:MAG: hypothetical protein KAG61_04935 [Bacteriovoracaceae bacterium]|nr:hypothetical protein [Bacteriovoracaceae bacterium]